MRYWKRRAAEVGEDEPERKEEFDEIANYYTREFSRFQNRWFRHPHNYNRY
jgi:hypothetical protein